MTLGDSSSESHVEMQPSDFEKYGGYILPNVSADTSSTKPRWICGLDSHGTKFDPPQVEGQPVTHFKNNKDQWEGHLATTEDEIDRVGWDDAAG